MAEQLASEGGLTVDHETLRQWMLAAGLWSRQRKRTPSRQRRARKAHFGELVQLDGSFHAWYETCGPRRCLIAMVDDATSRSAGRFSDEETIWAAAAVLRRSIEQHGVPLALYTDWKNVYVRAETSAGISRNTTTSASIPRWAISRPLTMNVEPRRTSRVYETEGRSTSRRVVAK